MISRFPLQNLLNYVPNNRKATMVYEDNYNTDYE